MSPPSKLKTSQLWYSYCYLRLENTPGSAAIPERCGISCSDLGSHITGSGNTAPHTSPQPGALHSWHNPIEHSRASHCAPTGQPTPLLVHRERGGTTGLLKHFNNYLIPLQAEVPYKMCQGRAAVLYGQGGWGRRPREVTALHNSEAVKHLTQIAALTLLLLTLILPFKPILLLSRASQEQHPKL